MVMISPSIVNFLTLMREGIESLSFPRKLAGRKSRGTEVIHFHDGHETSLILKVSQKNHSELYVFMNFEGPPRKN